MFNVHTLSMVEEPISLSFAFWPRFNIGTDKSGAQSGATLWHIHLSYLPNSNSFLCGASHTEAVSTFFGITWPWVDYNPRPSKVQTKADQRL